MSKILSLLVRLDFSCTPRRVGSWLWKSARMGFSFVPNTLFARDMQQTQDEIDSLSA